MSARSILARAGKFLWSQAALITFVAVGVLLARGEPGYNHVFGAYLVASLAVFCLKLWFGELSIVSLVFIFTNLTLCGWMLLQGNADIVPYLGVLLFGSMAAVAALLLALRRPLVFRQAERVAENYLDTGLRGAVALACLVLSLFWMPDPKYITVPILLLLGFRLAAPLRRLAYPGLLRLAGLEPGSGRAHGGGGLPSGFSPVKLTLTLASALVVASIGMPLLLDATRYDVTVPEPYVLPSDLLEQRRAELEAYVATAPGNLDTEALTELGLVSHNLGLFEESYLRRAKEVLDRVLFLEPDNAQALAWHGSNEVAFAIHTWKPIDRMRFIASGMAELDRAVEKAPEDPIVRLARIDVCLGVPRFVGLVPSAVEDVEKLLELARTRPQEADPILPFIHQRAGDVFAVLGRVEEARSHWRLALDLLPAESVDHQRIAAALRRARVGSEVEVSSELELADQAETPRAEEL